jgi:ubiquinone/menaquinone biosynthesis C-methylase UbiE
LSSSIKEGWDRISGDYQKRMNIPTDDVYWGDFVPTEKQLGALGNVNGKRILEIGCGGAQNSIALSKWGAETFGIDLSKNQILYGRKLAKNERVKVNLAVGDMEKLPFGDETFDIVMTAVSLFYVPSLEAAVREVNRVLVKDGYFTFSTAHPFTEGKLIRYRDRPAVAIRNYFKRRIVRWTDKLPDGSRVRMHSYYRTFQDYFDILIANGFLIESYVELERLEQNELRPLDREKIKRHRGARQQYRIIKEAPYWVLFKTRKNR